MQDTNKHEALDKLFSRVNQIAQANGGQARNARAGVSYPSTVVAEPRNEAVPELGIEMPDGAGLVLTPDGPLSIPYVLNVTVRSSYNGAPKSSCTVNYVNGDWKLGGESLADEHIRAWLKPSKLPTAF